MAHSMKVIGSTVNLMVEGKSFAKMVLATKDTFLMAKSMAMAYINGQMDQPIQAIGKIITFMDMEHKHGSVVANTLVNGKMEKCTEREK